MFEMKTTVSAMWLALALVCTTAQAGPAGDGGGGSAQAGKSQETQPPPAAKQRKQKPSGSFTPSEKVGADSAVSFPVDI
jgi:hypothetical protein